MTQEFYAAAARQRDADRARAAANRRHYDQLLRLAALSRHRRPGAPQVTSPVVSRVTSRVTAGERAALDMIWRQRQRYRRLELFLGQYAG